MKTDRVATFGSLAESTKKTTEKKKNKKVQRQCRERSIQQQRPAKETVFLAYSSQENSTDTDGAFISDDTTEISNYPYHVVLDHHQPRITHSKKSRALQVFFKQLYFNVKKTYIFCSKNKDDSISTTNLHQSCC